MMQHDPLFNQAYLDSLDLENRLLLAYTILKIGKLYNSSWALLYDCHRVALEVVNPHRNSKLDDIQLMTNGCRRCMFIQRLYKLSKARTMAERFSILNITHYNQPFYAEREFDLLTNLFNDQP